MIDGKARYSPMTILLGGFVYLLAKGLVRKYTQLPV